MGTLGQFELEAIIVSTLYIIFVIFSVKDLGFGQFDIFSWISWSAQQFFFFPFLRASACWFRPHSCEWKRQLSRKKKTALIDEQIYACLGVCVSILLLASLLLKKVYVKGFWHLTDVSLMYSLSFCVSGAHDPLSLRWPNCRPASSWKATNRYCPQSFT